MQRIQRMKRPALVLFACLVVLALSLVVTAASVAHTAAPLAWSPIYTPSQGEVWYPATDMSKVDGGPGGPTACSMDTAGTDGRTLFKPVWTEMYARQTDHTTFRVCGTFNGDGQVLLAYPGAAKPTNFNYSAPTTLCLDTYSDTTADGTPRALELYMIQTGSNTPSITSPSILVGEQP